LKVHSALQNKTHLFPLEFFLARSKISVPLRATIVLYETRQDEVICMQVCLFN
jgi:hypothetical protein